MFYVARISHNVKPIFCIVENQGQKNTFIVDACVQTYSGYQHNALYTLRFAYLFFYLINHTRKKPALYTVAERMRSALFHPLIFFA